MRNLACVIFCSNTYELTVKVEPLADTLKKSQTPTQVLRTEAAAAVKEQEAAKAEKKAAAEAKAAEEKAAEAAKMVISVHENMIF